MIKNVYWHSRRVSLLGSELNETLIFGKIFEKYSDKNFMKICRMGAELFHADRWTDGQTLLN